MKDFSGFYNSSSFWNKLADYAIKAGKECIKKALTLYYTLIDSDTPVWARTVIVGALGYFISPVDGIPDLLPGGYVDDIGILAAAILTVGAHVKAEHIESARQKLALWFG